MVLRLKSEVQLLILASSLLRVPTLEPDTTSEDRALGVLRVVIIVGATE